MKKTLKKYLTRAGRRDIIIRSPRKATAKRRQKWSLKIEQQEIEESTKRSEASRDAVMEIGNDN